VRTVYKSIDKTGQWLAYTVWMSEHSRFLYYRIAHRNRDPISNDGGFCEQGHPDKNNKNKQLARWRTGKVSDCLI